MNNNITPPKPQRCTVVESTSMTLIQRRRNAIFPVGLILDRLHQQIQLVKDKQYYILQNKHHD